MTLWVVGGKAKNGKWLWLARASRLYVLQSCETDDIAVFVSKRLAEAAAQAKGKEALPCTLAAIPLSDAQRLWPTE